MIIHNNCVNNNDTCHLENLLNNQQRIIDDFVAYYMSATFEGTQKNRRYDLEHISMRELVIAIVSNQGLVRRALNLES